LLTFSNFCLLLSNFAIFWKSQIKEIHV
jgi:hypothetical protein